MNFGCIGDQVTATIVDGINSIRIEDYRRVVEEIITNQNNRLSQQSENLLNALSKM